MKRLAPGFLLMLLCCCLSAAAQQPSPVPALLQWHSRYDIKQMAFSADGTYFVSIGDDKGAIVTDLKKRIPLKRIGGVEPYFLKIHPTAPFFYTASVRGDSLLVHKRSFPAGAIVGTTLVPGLPGCQLASPRLLEMSFPEESLLVPFSCSGTKTILEVAPSGQVLQQVAGLHDETLNALIKTKGVLWAATSHALWKQQQGVFKEVLRPDQRNDYFANMQLLGDTLVLLSDRQLLWYSLGEGRVSRSISVADFFAQSEGEMHRALRMSFHHPFVLDETGAAWLVNTRMPGRLQAAQPQPYSLARIGQEISYPLLSPERGMFEHEEVDPLLAYHAPTQTIAVLKGKEVRFVDRRQGELFRLGPRQLPIDDFYFTDVPGKLLLLSGDGYSNPAFLLNLANSRLEALGILNEAWMQQNPANYQAFEPQPVAEKLYRPSQQTYRKAPYYAHSKGVRIRYSDRDSCHLTLPDLRQVRYAGNGELQLQEKGGKVAKRLKLKLPEEEAFLDRYEYHAGSQLLALYFTTRMYGHSYVYAVDLSNFTLLKSLNNAQRFSDAIWLLPDARHYVRREGIYSLATDALVTPFPAPFTDGEHFVLSADGRYLCYSIAGYDAPDQLVAWDLQAGKPLLMGRQYGVEKLLADPHSGLLYSLGLEGILAVWDPAKASPVAQIVLDGQEEFEELPAVNPSYLLLLPNGYYMGENKYYQMLSLQTAQHSYSITEMDGLFHRPDKVLAALGYADPADVELLQQAAERRSKRFALQPAGPAGSGPAGSGPSDIRIQDPGQIPFFSPGARLALQAALPKGVSSYKGVRVYVNGTQVTPLAPLPTGGVYRTELELVDAVNHIRLCLVDARGAETPGDYLYVNSHPAPPGTLYVINIGVSAYKDSQYNLKYAAKDAYDLSQFFKSVTSYEKVLVANYSDQEVTKELLPQLTDFLKTAGSRDVVLCYFAGHGVLDAANSYYLATHAMDFARPALAGIAIEELAAVVAGSASRKKMIFIDACHSGLIDDMITPADSLHATGGGQRAVAIRGAKAANEPPTSSSIYFAFHHFNQGSGVDILAASSGNEYAYELGALKNGVFTYSLLSAFRTGEADVNLDKEISLSELKTYVASMTRQLTQGAQRPNFRQANLYQDIRLLKQQDNYVNQLMEAAQSGQLEGVKQLLEAGQVQVNQQDKKGFAALHYASRDGALQTVRYLLEQGADVHQKTDFGFSALHLAAWNSHARIVYALMEKGASPSRDLAEWQLQEIRAKQHAPTLQVLLQFEQVQQHERRYRLLAAALATGNLPAADSLYKAERMELDYVSLVEGVPALMHALPGGQREALAWMLAKGASPNLATPTEGYTPLMIAVVYGQAELVQLLLQNGADKGAKDAWGNTALEYARQNKKEHIIPLLQ